MPWVPSLVGMLAWSMVAGVTAVLMAQLHQAEPSRDWHVVSGGSGDGSATRPFGRVADAVAIAAPGDEILIGSGTYREPLRIARGGRPGAPLVIRASSPASRPTFEVAGRVATIAHPDVVLDGLILDGAFGADDAVRVTSAASRLVLRNLEVRRAGRDCVDMAAPTDVLVERVLIHHCLDATGGRRDAHGIVTGAVERLTVRDSEIHTFSGDALQFDPGRTQPGWTDVRLERLKLWLGPLPAPANGFAAGVVPGENGIDTKTPRAGRRSQLTAVDIEAWGFRGGLIANMAAFNIKERVDATIARATIRESRLAFRLRGPAESGARADLRDIDVSDVGTAIRYEDNLARLRIDGLTIGPGVQHTMRAAHSPDTHIEVRRLHRRP